MGEETTELKIEVNRDLGRMDAIAEEIGERLEQTTSWLPLLAVPIVVGAAAVAAVIWRPKKGLFTRGRKRR